MGRRKIEIQPITHERNRSVTFVKRKAGLMKKAYELGVLCSVDVAVIVLEERPSLATKLYQYCSSDIHDMLARQREYDGEADTKGAKDFSEGVDKGDDAAGYEDDGDEDKAPAPPPKKKAKTNKDDMEYRERDRGRANMTIPSPPISIRKLPSSNSSKPKTSIPTSSDRHTTRNGNVKTSSAGPPAKKQRLNKSPPPRSDSEDEEEEDPAPRKRRSRRDREYDMRSMSPPPAIGSGLTLPPPHSASSSMYNFPPPMSRYGGGGYGSPGLASAAGYFPPPMYDLPPPARSSYDAGAGMFEHLLRNRAGYGHAHGQTPYGIGVDWPIHPHSHLQHPPAATATSGASSSWNLDAFIHSMLSAPPPPPPIHTPYSYAPPPPPESPIPHPQPPTPPLVLPHHLLPVDRGEYTASWLNYLSGPGAEAGNVMAPPEAAGAGGEFEFPLSLGRRSGSASSWERGGALAGTKRAASVARSNASDSDRGAAEGEEKD